VAALAQPLWTHLLDGWGSPGSPRRRCRRSRTRVHL